MKIIAFHYTKPDDDFNPKNNMCDACFSGLDSTTICMQIRLYGGDIEMMYIHDRCNTSELKESIRKDMEFGGNYETNKH